MKKLSLVLAGILLVGGVFAQTGTSTTPPVTKVKKVTPPIKTRNYRTPPRPQRNNLTPPVPARRQVTPMVKANTEKAAK